MNIRIKTAFVAAVAAMLTFPAAAEFVKFHGKVVDDKGKPVKDAQIGILWLFDGKKYAPDQTLTVNAKDGTFSGELDVDAAKPVALLAFDKTQKRGGAMLVAPRGNERDLKVEIDTLVSLTGGFDVSSIRGNPETVEMVFEASMGGENTAPAFRVELPAKKRFNIKVPGGKYLLKLGCSGGEREPREVVIPNGKQAHDLKDKLVLSPITSRQAKKQGDEAAATDKNPNKGKAAKEGSAAAPPLTITDARGVQKTMKLSDYKGKWVLLEFWGHWCQPCITSGIPTLMKFQDEHKDQQDKFVILTYHHSRNYKEEPDLAAIQPKISELLKRLWKKDAFPFPIITDATEKTVRTWGVDGFPTAFLIDPDGNVVAQGHAGVEKQLAEALKDSGKK